MDVPNEVTVEEMERLICRLPSVLKCAVAVNDWGAVEEIHVLTNLDRVPKQIVRDVESALQATWNLRVDHKRISVAQILPEGQVGQWLGTEPAQLHVREYHLEADAVQQTGYARVILCWSDEDETAFSGEWTGRYLPSQYYQAMAMAAVEAVNQVPLIGEPVVLADIRTMDLANRTLVTVALSQYDKRHRETMIFGCSENRGDGQGASVRAVLNAVNRRLAHVVES